MAASVARGYSDVPGVTSALLDEYGQATERRKSPLSRRPDSATDVEDSSLGEQPSDEDESNTAWSDESPPDNSRYVPPLLSRRFLSALALVSSDLTWNPNFQDCQPVEV